MNGEGIAEGGHGSRGSPAPGQTLTRVRGAGVGLFLASPSGAEREHLLEEVLATIGNPVDSWAIAATLESMGLRDVDAVERYGAQDLFDLAQDLYERARWRLAARPSVRERPPEVRSWRRLVRFLRFYLQGVLFALPMAGQIAAVLALNYSLWAYLAFSEEQATVVAIGTILSLIVTGGFTQAISRRGMFYVAQKHYGLAGQVSLRFIGLGNLLITVVGLLVYGLNLLFSFYDQQVILVSLLYYVLLAELWLNSSVLYMLTQRAAILLSTLLGVGVVHLVMTRTDWGIYAAHALGLTLTNLVIVGYGYGLLSRRARRLSEEQKRARPPRLSILLYTTAPYFAYGVLYFGYLYLDRVIGWSVSEGSFPYPFWFHTSYELGVDWALISLILTIALLEYTINEFSAMIIPVQKLFSAFNLEDHNRYFKRFYGRQLVLLLVAACLSIVGTYKAVVALRLFQEVPLIRDFFSSPITFFTFWGAALGYNLLVVGLFNSVFFFSLSRPGPVLRAIVIAMVVNGTIGYGLSRGVAYPWSVVGLMAGSFTFALLTIRSAMRLLDRLDYYYYAAY